MGGSSIYVLVAARAQSHAGALCAPHAHEAPVLRQQVGAGVDMRWWWVVGGCGVCVSVSFMRPANSLMSSHEMTPCVPTSFVSL